MWYDKEYELALKSEQSQVTVERPSLASVLRLSSYPQKNSMIHTYAWLG